MKHVSIRLERYDEGNRRAAEIILQHIDAFGGEHAGLVRWATAVRARLAQKEPMHLRDSGVFEQFSAQLFEGEMR